MNEPDVSKDIQQAHQSLQELSQGHARRTPAPSFSPALEIENNLMGLLKFRIDRITEDAGFEDQLKQAMIDRLPEATFQEITQALAMVKDDANQSVQKILSPFIAKGDRVPLMDTDKDKQRLGSDEQVSGQASKDVLQGLNEFTKLISILGKATEEVPTPTPPESP